MSVRLVTTRISWLSPLPTPRLLNTCRGLSLGTGGPVRALVIEIGWGSLQWLQSGREGDGSDDRKRLLRSVEQIEKGGLGNNGVS